MFVMPPLGTPTPGDARRLRDVGLHRISVVTRVLVVGSIAAAGAFASLAAWAQPGRSTAAPATGTRSRFRNPLGGSVDRDRSRDDGTHDDASDLNE